MPKQKYVAWRSLLQSTRKKAQRGLLECWIISQPISRKIILSFKRWMDMCCRDSKSHTSIWKGRGLPASLQGLYPHHLLFGLTVFQLPLTRTRGNLLQSLRTQWWPRAVPSKCMKLQAQRRARSYPSSSTMAQDYHLLT